MTEPPRIITTIWLRFYKKKSLLIKYDFILQLMFSHYKQFGVEFNMNF
jgi:hypothetical protein